MFFWCLFGTIGLIYDRTPPGSFKSGNYNSLELCVDGALLHIFVMKSSQEL